MACVLPGCALLGGGSPALDTYELSAPTPKALPRSRSQILVAEPTALKSLDGQNIVVTPAPGVVQFLNGAQWSDRLPRILQAELVETFQHANAFAGVGKPGEGLAIDYQVITEVRRFEIDAAGGAHARIELHVRLLNDRNGVVRASQTFTGAAPVSGTGNDAYVAALDRAFDQVALDIVGWVSGQI
jgi:cholesterol transport system auxiliary component